MCHVEYVPRQETTSKVSIRKRSMLLMQSPQEHWVLLRTFPVNLYSEKCIEYLLLIFIVEIYLIASSRWENPILRYVCLEILIYH
jgi:hypothetical protein